MINISSYKKSFYSKHLFCVLVLLCFNLVYVSVRAQSISKPLKKVVLDQDTTRMAIDSTFAESAIKDPINYTCDDSLVYDFGVKDTLIFLHKGAKVESMSISIKADYLEVSRGKGTVYGAGVPDTAGVLQGKPVFKDGDEEYELETLTYNYTTKKARIINVSSKQNDGFLYGQIAKRMNDNTTFIKDAKYTTCDHPHPHFYLMMTQGKVVDKPSKNIYFGPSFLFIEDVPFPLVLPFGLFPQMSDRSSGIRIPTYGEEVSRGFFLRNLGYYFAIGDYMDLDLLADYYTLGTWAARANSRYTKRYKFSGGFNLEYANNIVGDKGSADYNESSTFSVRWNHSQDPKARPGTTFSSSVNFSSMNNNKFNNNTTHNPYNNINNSISSSVSYARSWEGSPINFSTSANHSQNMRDSMYTVSVPNITFTVQKLYPFAAKERVGDKKFYEDISFSYSSSFQNTITFKGTEVNSPGFSKKFTNGLDHKIGIGLPGFSVFKHIRVSPTVNYDTKWYFKTIDKSWDSDINEVVIDTAKAFSSFGATHQYSFGASASTKVVGIVQFKKGSMIQAIRHVVTPTININYTPDMVKAFNGYRYVQKDSLGTMEQYNIYEGQPFGYPSSRENGSIGFGINNNLEMKVRDRKDTTTNKGSKKIALLSTFSVTSAYNLLADSMNLADFRFSGSTNLPGKTAVSFGFVINPYAIDERGRTYNRFQWAEKGGLNLGRLTSFNLSFGYNFSGGKSNDGKKSNNNETVGQDNSTNFKDKKAAVDGGEVKKIARHPLVYEDFNFPWDFNFSFNYNYNKSYTFANGQLIVRKIHSPTFNFDTRFSPTENWDLKITSGIDITRKKLTLTSVNISRKLHCFNFTFDWVPLGQYKSWSFRIGILSSMLSDVLKYDKQESYYDSTQ